MGTEEDYQLKEWIITLNEYAVYGGIKIPVKGEATWKLDKGSFTWYELEVYDV